VVSRTKEARKYDRLHDDFKHKTLLPTHSLLQQVRETTVGSLCILFLASILSICDNIKEERRKEEKKLFGQPPWSNVVAADR
jgi:hypothetical protein